VDASLSETTPDERLALDRCGLGHGIGITGDELPIFSRENQTVIAPGMCLVVAAAAASGDGLALYADTIVI
jgi:Xaa-Pro aminopeptidase